MELRNSSPWTQQQCADAFHKTIRTWQNYEAGDSWPDKTLEQAICRFFKVNPRYFEGEEFRTGAAHVEAEFPPPFPVPIAEGCIWGSSGKFLFSDLTTGVDTTEVPAQFIKEKHRKDYVVLKLAGDSLWPDYPEGTYLLVNVAEQDRKNLKGKLVAVQTDAETAKAKILDKDKRGRWELRSINPKYLPLPLKEEPYRLAAIEAYRDDKKVWHRCNGHHSRSIPQAAALSLTEREKLVRQYALDALSTPAFIFNLTTWRSEYLNEALAKFVGHSMEEVLSWTPQNALADVHPDDKDEVERRLRDLYAQPDKSEAHCEYRIQQGTEADGTPIWHWAHVICTVNEIVGVGRVVIGIIMNLRKAQRGASLVRKAEDMELRRQRKVAIKQEHEALTVEEEAQEYGVRVRDLILLAPTENIRNYLKQQITLFEELSQAGTKRASGGN